MKLDTPPPSAVMLTFMCRQWKRLHWLMNSPDAVGDHCVAEAAAVMDQLDRLADELIPCFERQYGDLDMAAVRMLTRCSPSNAPKSETEPGR